MMPTMDAHGFDPLPDLERVLADTGVSAPDAQRIVRALVAAEDAEAVADLLLARPPECPAWLAPEAGYVHRTEAGLELTPGPAPAHFQPSDRRRIRSGDGAYCKRGQHEGWLLGPLEGRVPCVPSGTRVEAGTPLTEGPCALADVLGAVGVERAVAAAAERLAGLSGLALEDAGRVVRPLFSPVMIIDVPDGTTTPGLVRGALCTRRRHRIEAGRAIGLALKDLPADADPRLRTVAGLQDDEERHRLFHEQRLHDAARGAGLTLRVVSARPVYRGIDDIAALIEHDGLLDPPFELRLSERERDELVGRLDLALAEGYTTRAGLVEIAEEYLAPEDDRPDLREQMSALVDRMRSERVREQRAWQAETDPDRLARAFSALEDADIVARENFTCCRSCGQAEIGAEAFPGCRGFVYFHRGCTAEAVLGNGLTLYFGGFDDSERTTASVGHQVVAALEQVGLSVRWNGDPGRAIDVAPLDWRKRLVG